MWREADSLSPASYQCCINTELNSTNFLINGDGRKDYLIDWEKPLCGEPAQDLGHFLAPTTTFWKTDVILDETQMRAFVQKYTEAVNGRFDVDGLWERVSVYMTSACLRGSYLVRHGLGAVPAAGTGAGKRVHLAEAGGLSGGGISGKDPEIYRKIA